MSLLNTVCTNIWLGSVVGLRVGSLFARKSGNVLRRSVFRQVCISMFI